MPRAFGAWSEDGTLPGASEHFSFIPLQSELGLRDTPESDNQPMSAYSDMPVHYVCQPRHAGGLCLPTATISTLVGPQIVALGRHKVAGCRTRQT